MAQTLSFIILLTLIVVFGVVFVAVMQQFLLPLFMAILLVVMFRPLHAWFMCKLPDSRRLAAAATTISITAIVLIPLLLLILNAGTEAVAVASSADPDALVAGIQDRGKHMFDDVRKYAGRLGVELPPDREIGTSIASTLRDWIAPAALRTTQFVGSFLFGLVIMLIALYFFFADGADMVETVVKLTPMDSKHVRQMLNEFDRVSRAVVMATVLSSVGQGLLAGIGYLIVGMPHLFLLTAGTALLTFVPFIGATLVWGGSSLWLYFIQGRTVAAIFLAIWGILVVSTADNFIKPYVLQGQSNLHPLLALLSVLGGVQALGPIGIFVGPMVVSFLYALLQLLRTELKESEPAGTQNLV